MEARDGKSTPTGDESLAARAEIVLLTIDGADFRLVAIDALDGVITLSGEVGTEPERKRAAAEVRRIDGVRQVNNQLRVVRRGFRRSPDQTPGNHGQPAVGSHETFEPVKAAGSYGAEASVQILENGKAAQRP
jgi:hypothetical protein